MKKILFFTPMLITTKLSAQTTISDVSSPILVICIAAGLISLLTLFTFLAMAGHVKRIMLAVENLYRIELNKKGNASEKNPVLEKDSGEVK